MSGILGAMFQPESTVPRRTVEDLKHTLFNVIGPEALDEALSEEQRAQLRAATLGIARNDLPCVDGYLVDHVRGDSRRDESRERVWAIEADLISRFPAEITSEIERARAKPPDERSKATRKRYAAEQRHFAAWCKDLGVASMPVEPPTLATYLLDACPPSTVGRKLAALADLHRRGGRILPRQHPLCSAAIAISKARAAAAEQAKAAATQQPAAPPSGAGEEEKPNG